MSTKNIQKNIPRRPNQSQRRNTIFTQSRISLTKNMIAERNKPCTAIDVIYESFNLILNKLSIEITKKVELQKVNLLEFYISNILEVMMQMDSPIQNNIKMEHNNQEEPVAPMVHTCGYNSKVIKPVLKEVPQNKIIFDTFYDRKIQYPNINESYKTTMGLMKYPDSGLRKLQQSIQEEQEEPFKSMRMTVKYTLPLIKPSDKSSNKQPGANIRSSHDDAKQNQSFKKKPKSNFRLTQYSSGSKNQSTVSSKTQRMFRAKLSAKPPNPILSPISKPILSETTHSLI